MNGIVNSPIVNSPGSVQMTGMAGWHTKIVAGQPHVLLLGGSGLLGRELQKLRKFDWVPSHAELDISDYGSICRYFGTNWHLPDLIVNCAAHTAVEKAETDKDACYRTNVVGVRNLLRTGIPVLQISTAYVFDGAKGDYKEGGAVNPLNYYALTKALAEEAVLGSGNGVVLRTLFKPRPWPFPRAYDDQITSGGYVDEIALKVDWCIGNFDRLPAMLHVGMQRQSIYDLARETRDVGRMSRKEVAANLPADVSLNDQLYNQLVFGGATCGRLSD